jgi:hypothetical protein
MATLTPELEAEVKKIKEQKLYIPDSQAILLAKERIASRGEPSQTNIVAQASNEKSIAEVSPTIGMLQSMSDKAMPSLTPSLVSEKAKQQPGEQAPTPPEPGADTGNKEIKQPTISDSYKDLLSAYTGLGERERKELQTSYDGLNNTIKEMNEGFEAQMAEAKGKAEKEKTRAEWASIASMLAKNIVGFGAALNGINPQAMAYETMDWGKRIADINQNMNTELSLLRETMRDKVNDARLQVAGAKDKADIGLRGRMAELDARGEMLRAQMREQGDTERAQLKADADVAEAQAKAGMESTTVKPETLNPARAAMAKAKSLGEIADVAASYGVDIGDIKASKKEADPWFGFNDEAGFKAAMMSKIEEKLAGKPVTSRTVRTPTGQPAQPMVQSEPQEDTPLDVFNQLPRDSEYWYQGKKLRKL